MQTLYAYKSEMHDNLSKDEKFLLHSLDNLYNLYLSIMALLIALYKKSVDYNIKFNNKLLSISTSELSTKSFEDNEILQIITQNKQLQEVISRKKLNVWDLDFEYVDRLFKTIRQSKTFREYDSKENKNFKTQKQFIIDIYSNYIATDSKLYDYFEDKKLTWVDDIPLVNTHIVKILGKLKLDSPENMLLPELYKDEDDKTFAKDLLTKTLLNSNKFDADIAQKSKNWDTERLASIDKVLLKMALCEFQKFPSIPFKVTINEYIEIAKEYSTPKSSIFINGVLDRIVKEYTANNQYPKSGRGLM